MIRPLVRVTLAPVRIKSLSTKSRIPNHNRGHHNSTTLLTRLVLTPSLPPGRYLAQFYYLDRGWVEGNVDKIFPQEEEELWKAAFSGYLVNSNRPPV